jgi:hypothetical protein
MKRFGSALAAPILPALFLFVLTARPARLYAESSTAPVPTTSCANLAVAPCEGKATAEACTTSGGKAGTCKSTACKKEDGTATSVLTCVVSLSTQPTQGNTVPEGEQADAGPSTTTKEEGCAVGAARGAPGAAAGGFALFGLGLAAFAFARRARRG